MSRRVSIEVVRELFSKRGYFLVSDAYLNNTTKVTVVDSEGYKYYTSLKGLANCGGELSRYGNGNIYTYDNISLFLLRNNSTLIIDEDSNISGTRDKFYVTCSIDGFRSETNIGNILRSEGRCRKCSGLEKSIDEIKLIIKSVNNNIEILDNEYISATHKMKCKCLIDGHIWEANYNRLSYGRGCPKCKVNAISRENSKYWKGGITPIHTYLRDKINIWKNESMTYCGFKCVISNKNFNTIHHLLGYDSILNEVFSVTGIEIKGDICNYTEHELRTIQDECVRLHNKYPLGVCLSEEVHKEFHTKYGYGNNTPEEFYEFYYSKTGRDFQQDYPNQQINQNNREVV